MRARTSFPLVDQILGMHAAALGRDAVPYRNHVCRVLNYYSAFVPEAPSLPDHLQIAGSFHDLGIWTAGTFDYLDPSRALAAAYLAAHGLERFAVEVDAVILEHHKLTPYTGAGHEAAEAFRRADRADVSRGIVRGKIPARFVQEVEAAFPNAGFQVMLLALAWRRFREHPLSPMPMVRW